ncbi:MAG: Gfo/Idh/MocA family oxidoreductase [Spirochaetaceae bacterium]|nr:MAG: Gfo/Idh/MocA family oxidoreductase [Spirochaetaceae bacterium]
MSYGFGIIGLGLIADFHAKAIQAISGGKGALVACCSRSTEKAKGFGGKYGCRGYADLGEFLAHPGLDVVSICGPSGAHLEPALAAAEAGKHVIVEKPLEITPERCDKIISACEKAKVSLAGIFQSRFSEVAGLVKRTVEQGRFGTLVLGDAYVKWFRSQQYYDDGGWHGTQRFDGGGALINQSIHAIDLLQWFMGPVDSVQAFTGTIGHQRIEVEDNAVAALRFRNGAFGVIEGSTAVYPGFLKRIEISGTKGSMVLEEETLKTWEFAESIPEDEEIRQKFGAGADTKGGAADPAAISFEGHRRQFEEFIAALDEGRAPLVDGREARKAVEIIRAIYASAKKGKPVHLS